MHLLLPLFSRIAVASIIAAVIAADAGASAQETDSPSPPPPPPSLVTAPCTVTTGDSHIILNVVESTGAETSQVTSPEEMPVSGFPGDDIRLELFYPESKQFESHFALDGKRLKLLKPLDRDEGDLSSIMFQVTCTTIATGRRKTIPVVLTISDVNDNGPEFLNLPYVVTVPESTPVDSTIFAGLKALDVDSNVNGQVEFRVIEDNEGRNDVDGDVKTSGAGHFAIDLPHQGLVRLVSPLDYETSRVHYVVVEARDRAVDPASRFSATTTLTVNVLDSDDLDPSFAESEYTSEVTSGAEAAGALRVRPEKLRAQDGDTLRARIRYSFAAGKPASYANHFAIDPHTGIVSQTSVIGKNEIAPGEMFDIIVRAEEASPARRSAQTRLLIRVLAEDATPPELRVTAGRGYVAENSPIGARVRDAEGNDIKLIVTDRDFASAAAPDYEFELTTTSFRVDGEGYLVVDEANLDRDAPNEAVLKFQVFVREVSGSRKSSSPVALTVELTDENDNAPVIENGVEDVSLPAGSSRRQISKLEATDLDASSAGSLRYSLVHVSNNGQRKFTVNPRTGVVEVVAAVEAGERYSLTVAATDAGGKKNRAILEVRVTEGPNLRGPVFEQFLYEAKVSEGAPKFTSVVTAFARDPEGGPVTYSISGGNEEGHFEVEESTGVVRVMEQLDRESISRYTLTVRAEDTGGKHSTATVQIAVTDVNDEVPHFEGTPYSFRVREGESGADVGRVRAVDDDVGDNANVYYKVPEDSPFSIDTVGGQIRTKTSLDFERQPVHYVIVSAMDRGRGGEEKSSTATVTVLVQDTADEVPIFDTPLYEATVPENVPNFIVATVTAKDLDTDASITYRLVAGDLDKFAVDPDTGVVRTIRGLDFERAKHHELIIGTEEGRMLGSNEPKATCRVSVSVTDVNDVQPMFVRTPRGNVIDVTNDVAVGKVIGTVAATDSDGAEPGNVVRYAFVEEDSSEHATRYFAIGEETGEISVTDDLTKELYDEYRLEVRAYDLGEPSLDSIISIIVRVRQVVTVAPDSGVGFAELEYKISLVENVAPGAPIALLPLEQKPGPEKRLRIRCEVVSVKDSRGLRVRGLFDGRLNRNRDCELFLADGVVDRESNESFEVEMKLATLTAYANPKRIRAKILLSVVDANDNPPRFEYDEQSPVREQYLTAIPDSTPIDQTVFKVRATDADSGPYGEIEYSITGDRLAREYFAIDARTGEIKTTKSFESISNGDLPLEVIVLVRDNPENTAGGGSNSQRTMLVVNLLRKGDGLVLTISNTPPEVMREKKAELTKLLQEQTGLAVSVDHITASLRPHAGNGTCCRVHYSDTDVYFHATDPNTNQILSYDSPKLQRALTSKRASSDLRYTVSGRLGVQASDLHQPYPQAYGMMLGVDPVTLASPIKRTTSEGADFNGLPALLIAFGCLVFALAVAAIAYLCVVKRRLQVSDEKTTKMIVIPRYEPVFVEPNFKEYETQVLRMSVPIDDLLEDGTYNRRKSSGSGGGGGGGGRRNSSGEHFSLDSISYITKDRMSYGRDPSSSPATSGGASSERTRTTAATYKMRDGGSNVYSMPADDVAGGMTTEDDDPITPIRNPLFAGRGSEEGLQHMSVTGTNANNNNAAGLFGEFAPSAAAVRADTDDDLSPIDTTTQL